MKSAFRRFQRESESAQGLGRVGARPGGRPLCVRERKALMAARPFVPEQGNILIE